MIERNGKLRKLLATKGKSGVDWLAFTEGCDERGLPQLTKIVCDFNLMLPVDVTKNFHKTNLVDDLLISIVDIILMSIQYVLPTGQANILLSFHLQMCVAT